MTKIDFYILSSKKAPKHDLFACKLSEKIYKGGHRLFINTNNEQQSQQIDKLLWTFRESSFVPHSISTSAQEPSDPVQLAHDLEPDQQQQHEVLLNLADEVPSFFSQFPRVAEIVSQEDVQKKHARERFKFYRDRGYKIDTHTL